LKNAEQTRNEEQRGREKYGKYEDPNPTQSLKEGWRFTKTQ
jgi:hypothetical protein